MWFNIVVIHLVGCHSWGMTRRDLYKSPVVYIFPTTREIIPPRTSEAWKSSLKFMNTHSWWDKVSHFAVMSCTLLQSIEVWCFSPYSMLVVINITKVSDTQVDHNCVSMDCLAAHHKDPCIHTPQKHGSCANYLFFIVNTHWL